MHLCEFNSKAVIKRYQMIHEFTTVPLPRPWLECVWTESPCGWRVVCAWPAGAFLRNVRSFKALQASLDHGVGALLAKWTDEPGQNRHETVHFTNKPWHALCPGRRSADARVGLGMRFACADVQPTLGLTSGMRFARPLRRLAQCSRLNASVTQPPLTSPIETTTSGTRYRCLQLPSIGVNGPPTPSTGVVRRVARRG